MVIIMAGATRLKPKPRFKSKPILKQFTGSIAISQGVLAWPGSLILQPTNFAIATSVAISSRHLPQSPVHTTRSPDQKLFEVIFKRELPAPIILPAALSRLGQIV